MTIFTTKSPARNAWWKETVMPSFKPERRIASSKLSQILRSFAVRARDSAFGTAW